LTNGFGVNQSALIRKLDGT